MERRDVAHRHVDEALLRRVLEEEDLSPTLNEILLHAVASCPQCNEQCGDLLELWREGLLGDPEAFAFGSAEVFLGRSRRQALEAWKTLKLQPSKELRARVEADPALHGWGMVELLCHESRRLASSAPEEALAMADLAVSLAAETSVPDSASTWRTELEALTLAHRSNALRVLDDLQQAHRVMWEAERRWATIEAHYFEGYRPQILSLKASLRIDQRRLPEAENALRSASLLCEAEERAGEPPTAELGIRLLVKRSILAEQVGNLGEGVALLEKARARMAENPVEERLFLCALHNQFFYLTRLGKAEEAEALLPELESCAAAHASEIDQLRIKYAKARLRLLKGDAEGALERFWGVRQGFLDRDLGFDAALTSLELAVIYFGRRNLAEVERLAVEIFTVFQMKDLHREALAALSLFRNAASARQLTERFLNGLTDYLHRARHDPQLRFAPGFDV